MRFLRILPLFMPTLALSGCFGRERNAPSMQLASAPRSENESGATRLATGRCLGAERCGEVGVNSRLRDFDHCLAVMRNEAERELDFCRDTGVNHANVEKCSMQWATEDCEGATAPLSAIPSCRHESICL